MYPLIAGNTALHDCAESGSLEIMQMLLQYGASMEKDGYSMTPLLSASVTGHTNIVEYLTMHEQVKISFIYNATYVYIDVCLRVLLGSFKSLQYYIISSTDKTQGSH